MTLSASLDKHPDDKKIIITFTHSVTDIVFRARLWNSLKSARRGRASWSVSVCQTDLMVVGRSPDLFADRFFSFLSASVFPTCSRLG